jgi:hypothetical protein
VEQYRSDRKHAMKLLRGVVALINYPYSMAEEARYVEVMNSFFARGK